jgi:hypothetical protein
MSDSSPQDSPQPQQNAPQDAQAAAEPTDQPEPRELQSPTPTQDPQPGQPHFRPAVQTEGAPGDHFRAVPGEGNPQEPVPNQPIADHAVEGVPRPEENPAEPLQEYQRHQAAAAPSSFKGDEPIGQEATQPAPSRPSDQQPGNQVPYRGTVD